METYDKFLEYLQEKLELLSEEDLFELFLIASKHWNNPWMAYNTEEGRRDMADAAISNGYQISEDVYDPTTWEIFSKDHKYVEYDWDCPTPTTTNDLRFMLGFDGVGGELTEPANALYTHLDLVDLYFYMKSYGVLLDPRKMVYDNGEPLLGENTNKLLGLD